MCTPDRTICLSLLLTGCIVVLAACGGRVAAPVVTPGMHEPAAPVIKSEPSPTTPPAQPPPADGHHVVVRGDTLYSIAWRYGRDYRTVAAWNSITAPYLIRPGVRIRVTPPAVARQTSPPLADAPATRQPSPPVATAPAPARTDPAPAPTPAPRPAAASALSWQWPTDGSLLQVRSPTAEKGINIGGRRGQQILAAAPGQVVYSGGGLIGYGKLIIIKHSDTYLSAYAHNNELLVKEGDSVSSGQQIATMGTTNDGRALLHFEIRRNGQPIDPLQYLPRRSG